MTLPWNRGDDADRTPAWVDLLPLVGGETGESSGPDREAANEPVLVAPHRDPGEEAVTHELPPGFERARRAAGAPDGSTATAPDPVDGSPATEAPASSSPADRSPGETAPATVESHAGASGPVSADATTPGSVPLESVVGDDVSPTSRTAESSTAAGGSADPGAGDAAGDESDVRADDGEDGMEESRDPDERSDTMTVNGT